MVSGFNIDNADYKIGDFKVEYLESIFYKALGLVSGAKIEVFDENNKR
jgi:hypothetical protein